MNKCALTLAAAGVLLFSPVLAEEPVSLETKPAVESRGASVEALIASGQIAQAQREIDAWIKLDKKASDPYAYQAELAFGKKAYKRALSMGEKALDKDSENARAYYWRGRAYEQMKDWMEAANEFRAALLIRPDFEEATEGLSRVKGNLSALAQP